MELTNIEFEKLQNEYFIDLDEKLQKLEESALEIQELNDVEQHIKSILSRIHSIKGSSGAYQLNAISTLCHAYESFMSKISYSPLRLANKLIELVDTIKNIMDFYRTKQPIDQREFLVKLGLELSEQGAKHILLVDDSALFQKAILQLGEKLSFNVTVAKAWLEGLNLLEMNSYNYIITSQSLPGIGLNSFLGAIKYLKNCVDIKIIIATSDEKYTLPDEFKQCVVLGKNRSFIYELKNILTLGALPKKSERVASKEVEINSIVFLDDDLSTIQIVQHFLQKISHLDTHYFLNSRTALDYLGLSLPSVIITDLNLAGESGLDFIHAVKANESLAKIPILLMTAEDQSFDDLISKKVITAVIKKPFKPQNLYLQIKELVGKGTVPGANAAS